VPKPTFDLKFVSRLPPVVGIKSPRDVRVGESPALEVGWLNAGLRSEAPKKRRTALCRSTVGKVKCAALR